MSLYLKSSEFWTVCIYQLWPGWTFRLVLKSQSPSILQTNYNTVHSVYSNINSTATMATCHDMALTEGKLS